MQNNYLIKDANLIVSMKNKVIAVRILNTLNKTMMIIIKIKININAWLIIMK